MGMKYTYSGHLYAAKFWHLVRDSWQHVHKTFVFRILETYFCMIADLEYVMSSLR